MKFCKVCGTQIFGRRRKYCGECKSKVHKKQMNKYYESNKCKWLCINGKYNKKDTGQICTDTLPFNDSMYKNPKTELIAIEEEMKRLGLKPIKHEINKKKIDNARFKKYYKNNKSNNKHKSLHYEKLDNCYLIISLLYNTKTDHIGIRTKRGFYKGKSS